MAGGLSFPGALYWRGRIYEDEEKNFGQAVNYYHAVTASYINSYYAGLAQGAVERTEDAGAECSSCCGFECGARACCSRSDRGVAGERATSDQGEAAGECGSERIHRAGDPGEFDLERMGCAGTGRDLLVVWGDDAGVQSMKHSGISFFSLPLDQVPTIYWKLLFPQPYWSDLVAILAEEWVGSLPGGVVDSAGVGVQRGSGEPCERLWADAAAAVGGKVDGEEAGDQGTSMRICC